MEQRTDRNFTDLRLRLVNTGAVFHERAPDASLERLREVLGIIKFNGRVPSWRDLDEDEPFESDNAGT